MLDPANTGEKTRSASLRNWIIVVCGIVVAAGTGFPIYLHLTSGDSSPNTAPSIEASGSIAAPAADDGVSYEVLTSGTIHDIPAAGFAWVVTEVVGPDGHEYYDKVKSVVANHLWPGPESVKRLPDDRWEARVPLGSRSNPASIGLHFRITLVVADGVVDAQFRQYNATAQAQEFRGITPPPPAGLTRLAEVKVVLAPGSP